jgi:hypothetical protein
MLKDVIAVQPLKDYQLHLTFDDRQEGIVDLAEIIEFSGIFEPLKDPIYFATVHVDPDLGTICWDNGADLDPVVLYAKISNPAQSLSDIHDRLLPKLMSGEIRVKEAEEILANTL